jgi:uncharacterized protein (DUF2252 family)
MQSTKQRRQKGKDLRKQIPRSAHGAFERQPDVNPVAILLGQDEGRVQSLVPVRHQRMGESAYAFYRAGAKLMAIDLATTPTTNLMAQLCGDAHLANFGWYGSPERDLVFDVNDFDETLPGSFEWDLKRMAASFAIASADNGFDEKDSRKSAAASVNAYRDAMSTLAKEGFLDVWYTQVSADQILDVLEADGKTKKAKHTSKKVDKARGKDSMHVLGKLTEKVDGQYRIKSDPPFVVPLRHMAAELGVDTDDVKQLVENVIAEYVESVPDHFAVLLGRYQSVDVAFKVVGVGSVGTRCFIVFLEGRDGSDPLFLQIKEASKSVLEAHFSPSAYDHSGRRVVEGQQLMQASSDIFLGWTSAVRDHQYYVRQFKDMKASVEVASLRPKDMRTYAEACGSTLARSHSRSGDPAVISGYMGSGNVFADAITDFAVAYATQNNTDYQTWMAFMASEGAPDVS